ncbi:MAG: ABC transporter ATP-binding protein [Nitrospirae bacterium]|nr:ABC transporter ATP-binding protein [Nitrospirota bacterium]
MSLIEVRSLKKTFFTEAGPLEVLKGIDLTVEKGDMLAITGASGVGKSTLLHILGTLDRPSEGSIYFEGKNVFDLNHKEIDQFRNQKIGFVFQFHHLLPEFTAFENVIMPALIGGVSMENVKRRAEVLLSELGLEGRFHHRPGELSGGEQQRVAVARALIMSPIVVLADEPTGNLDTRTGDKLFKTLRYLNESRGITFIIVTHNESLAQQCHRAVHMVDGRIE